MDEIKWKCPICGTENAEKVESFADKDYLTKHFECNECNEQVLAYLEYKPIVIHLDLV